MVVMWGAGRYVRNTYRACFLRLYYYLRSETDRIPA